MSKPMIAILSKNPQFTSEMPELLKERYLFLICDDLDDLRDLLKTNHPSYFVADFIDLQGGGHAEDRPFTARVLLGQYPQIDWPLL